MANDFVLIYPPSYGREMEFPIGGLFLGHALIKNGYTCKIINEFRMESILGLIDKCIEEGTAAFGLSIVSSRVVVDAIDIAKYIKDSHPQIPIVWGGPHVSALPEQTLASQYVDYIVWGEGEKTLPLLLDNILSNKHTSIPGVGFISNQEISFIPSNEFTALEGIYELPYHLLDVNRYYRKMNLGGTRWLSALYSRGCPFECTFCINSNYRWKNNKVRFHSLDHIMFDLNRLIRDFGADGITLMDDHFFINEKRVVEICEAIKAEKFNVRFRANGRIDTLDRLSDSTYQLLQETGFVAIGAGVESGSPGMLKIINKNITLKQVHRVDEKLSRYGIKKHWNFITALPGEDIEDVRLTLKLIAKLAKTSFDSPFPFSSYKKFIPLPGTKLYEDAIAGYDLKEPRKLEEWGAFSHKYEIEDDKFDVKNRPWLSPELLIYTNLAQKSVAELNALYTGNDADIASIKEKIVEIEILIEMTPDEIKKVLELNRGVKAPVSATAVIHKPESQGI